MVYKSNFLSKIRNVLVNIRSSALLWDTITTTFWSSVGKGAGFLVPLFIAVWFGISEQTDAFFFAYSIILFLTMLFSPAVESVIVPYIAEGRAKKQNIGKFVTDILFFSSLISLILSIGLVVFIKPALGIITNFDKAGIDLIYELLIETIPLMILLIWTSILTGALNAYKKFVLPAIAPAIRAGANLLVIFFLKEQFGVHSIVIGYIIGELVRFVVLVFQIKALKLFEFSFSLKWDIKLKAFLKTASYQTVGMVALGINPLVGKIMASWLDKGSVSILEYASRLYAVPETFMSAGIMTTTLAHWSSDQYESNSFDFKNKVNKVAKLVGFGALSITILLIIFNKFIVKLAFGHGQFPKDRINDVSLVLIYLLLGFVPYMIGRIYVRAHLTLKNTKVIMQYGFLSVLATVFLNTIFMPYFKINGIALTTSLVSFFYLLYTMRSFNQQMKRQL